MFSAIPEMAISPVAEPFPGAARMNIDELAKIESVRHAAVKYFNPAACVACFIKFPLIFYFRLSDFSSRKSRSQSFLVKSNLDLTSKFVK